MDNHFQSLKIQNVSELRSILNEMSLENENTIKGFLEQYLEDIHPVVKHISSLCWQELAKKQENLENVIKFSMHLLNEVEVKTENIAKCEGQLKSFQSDFDRLLTFNEELKQKIEQLEQENSYYKNKAFEAETQATENSQIQSITANIDNLSRIQTQKMQKLTLTQNFSHLTERPSPRQSEFIPKQKFQQKVHQYEQTLQSKSILIDDLQYQIRHLEERIYELENEFKLKSSELELSQIFYKEKIDIIASNEDLSRKNSMNISELEIHSVFKRDLLRMESVKSIQSFSQSQSSSQSQNDNLGEIPTANQYVSRNSKTRKSLMQQFNNDFVYYGPGSMYASMMNLQSVNDQSCIMRQREKSISVSTADFKDTETKGVQTGLEQSIKRRGSHLPMKKSTIRVKNQQSNLDSSFLSLGTFSSIFSKKKEKKSEEYTIKSKKQVQGSNEIGQSSIGDIFKGIFDYATKKIVTNRINKKSRTSTVRTEFK